MSGAKPARSHTSRRTMTAATVVAMLAWAIAIAAFVPLAIHGSGPLEVSPGLAGAMAVFGLMSVVLWFVVLAFVEDMSRMGFSSDEKRRWQAFFLALGPVAAAMYWWRYVRVAPTDTSPPTS